MRTESGLKKEKKKKTKANKYELEKGGAGEGGAVELWERRTDGGLHFGLKVESLRCDFRVGEWKSMVGILEEGEGRAC